MSSVNDSLKFTSSDTMYANMLKFSAFAVQKLLTFFSAKKFRLLCIKSAKTVNEMTLNELVKLTTLSTTRPCSLLTLFVADTIRIVLVWLSFCFVCCSTSNGQMVNCMLLWENKKKKKNKNKNKTQKKTGILRKINLLKAKNKLLKPKNILKKVNI